MKTTGVAVALVLLFGCCNLVAAQKPEQSTAPKAKAVCPARTVSFSRDVLPILQDHCAACHFDDQKWPGINLATAAAYARLVNKKSAESGDEMLVKPGDPVHSFLVQKVSPTPPAGDPMPNYGRPLGAEEKELLVQWIRQGAKNN